MISPVEKAGFLILGSMIFSGGFFYLLDKISKLKEVIGAKIPGLEETIMRNISETNSIHKKTDDLIYRVRRVEEKQQGATAAIWTNDSRGEKE